MHLVIGMVFFLVILLAGKKNKMEGFTKRAKGLFEKIEEITKEQQERIDEKRLDCILTKLENAVVKAISENKTSINWNNSIRMTKAECNALEEAGFIVKDCYGLNPSTHDNDLFIGHVISWSM